MEACNQKRALQAMAEAEERFKANDLDGAIRVVQRVHALFPSLPQLSNLAIVFRILSIASGHQAKNSASFWHAILGSKPSDSTEAIRHQYRKMCLHTHPDKNQSSATAADGAFKLVAQAWEALSTVRAKKANSSTGGPKKASPNKGCSSSRRGQRKAQENKSSSSCSESGFRVYVSSGKAQIFSEVKPDGSYRVTVHL